MRFFRSFLVRFGGADRIGVVRWESSSSSWEGARAGAVAVSILWSLMVAAAVCVHGDGAGVMGGGTSLGVALWWHRGQMAICLGSFGLGFSGGSVYDFELVVALGLIWDSSDWR